MTARKAFVVGHPVAHSRSPLIHRFWLERHGLDGSYERVDVDPAGFPAFLERVGELGFVGGNVTIPHKEAAFRGVAHATDRAHRLEAVNTVWLEDGRVHGDNTDVLGFMAHLLSTLGEGWPREARRGALVLGAGGAARAVVAGLLDCGLAPIFVANRTRERAEQVSALDPAGVRVLDWGQVETALGHVDLLVNATSLGMTGQPPLVLDPGAMPDGAAVADIVYAPLETPLLAAARARGLRPIDGLGMLLHQAVPGFARWFGVTPQVTPDLRALVVADLERAGARR